MPAEKRETGQGEHIVFGKKYHPEQRVNLLRRPRFGCGNLAGSVLSCKFTDLLIISSQRQQSLLAKPLPNHGTARFGGDLGSESRGL
jgi:hypothetical protein